MTRFVTVDELVYINEQFPAKSAIHTIVNGKRAVRDMGLLEAAAGRPAQTVFGEDAYPTLTEKAAALLHAIARNHPFADGNKRTATVAALFMLDVNGARAIWQADEALERIVALAEGKTELHTFAEWLPTESCPPSPDPDAEADSAIIRRILVDHRTLLDDLALR